MRPVYTRVSIIAWNCCIICLIGTESDKLYVECHARCSDRNETTRSLDARFGSATVTVGYIEWEVSKINRALWPPLRACDRDLAHESSLW